MPHRQKAETMFVNFWDMHSGGTTKLPPYENIYIEAESEAAARVIFGNRFKRDPDHLSCRCCGGDYAVSSSETLEEETKFHRKRDGRLGSLMLLEEYLAQPDVLVIWAKEITPEDRKERHE